MAEKWRRYETLMIFAPELGAEGTEEHVQRAREFVTQESGRVLKSERWGNRDLAFELKGRGKGYYFLLEYAGLPRVASEVDRRLNLMDTVLKFQTIKLAEELDPASLPDTEEVVEAPAASEAAPAEAAPEAPAKKPAPEAEEEDTSGGDEDVDEDEGAQDSDETQEDDAD